VGLAAAYDLIEQRENGVASAVENARAAYVNHVNVRQDGNDLLGIGGREHPPVHQGLAHQRALHMRAFAVALVD
jgi:hypothetical protein